MNEEQEQLIPDNVQSYVEAIEEMFTKQPDKRKKEYKIWVKEINELIIACNKIKDKLYNEIRI